MKKTVEIEDLCCERCAKRLANAMELEDGVLKAKANYAKGLLYLETDGSFTDEKIRTCVEEKGFVVKEVRDRRGIFG